MYIKKTLFIFFITLFSANIFAQSGIQYPKSDTISVKQEYPYILPIWGQELTNRNIKFQLPFGINTNYVYNRMELEMSDFSLDINGISIDGINAETLAFQPIIAKSNGINIRADVWILPFFNFYGLYAESNGSTQVSMVPFETELIELNPVPFKTSTLGIGTTFAYGWNDYFVSVDANYTKSKSDILEDKIDFLVASARIGRRETFKNGMALSVYFGAMYRNTTKHEANNGNVMLSEYFPELKGGILSGIDERITINEDKIADPDYPYSESDPTKVALRTRNTALKEASNKIENAPPGQVNYSLKKDIIQKWSTQVGFNWEITPNWMYRGELGYSSGQTFFLTGLQYRFGL